MRWLRRFFLSTQAMVILVAVFAVSMAAATFIENDFGSQTARAVVYSAPWFRVLMLLVAVNLAGQIVLSRLWRKGKRCVLLFHAAFLVILTGAGVTTFFGFEGRMHISEGEVSRSMLSGDATLQVTVKEGETRIYRERRLTLSRITRNRCSVRFPFQDRQARVRLKQYIPDAVREIVEDDDGGPVLALLVSEKGVTRTVFLEDADVVRTAGAVFAFHRAVEDTLPVVVFRMTEDGLTFSSSHAIEKTTMFDNRRLSLMPSVAHPLEPMVFYALGGLQFALKTSVLRGRIGAVPAGSIPQVAAGEGDVSDALVLDIDMDGHTREVAVFGKSGQQGKPSLLHIEDVDIHLSYGSKTVGLPFGLRLTDFRVERYPGSRKPSSFASDVVVLDDEKDVAFPYPIYMNHTLTYRGYRFFQHSYDRDEQGTVLSVAYDPGTPVTYAGYALLILGLVVNLFMPQSRFRMLGRRLEKLRARKAALLPLVFLALLVPAGRIRAQAGAEEALRIAQSVDGDHAGRFGMLLVQDAQGRVKPINSLGHELLHDVSGSKPPRGLHPDRVVLGMLVMPDVWQCIPIIRIEDARIEEMAGIDPGTKKATFVELWDPRRGSSKLDIITQERFRQPSSRNDPLFRHIQKVQQRFRLCYDVYTGRALRIFPVPGDVNHAWVDVQDAAGMLPDSLSQTVTQWLRDYVLAVEAALENGRWADADALVDRIADYQQTVGRAVVPSHARIKAEIFYNEADPFRRLIALLLVAGILLRLCAMIQMTRSIPSIDRTIRALKAILILALILYTAGMGLRWIVAGHAPWSNKYESMITIAWATLLAGVLFSRRNAVPLAVSSVMAGIILYVCHLPGTDPRITPLPPVLKSVWLVIHVSVIISSYGFFIVSALLAFCTLWLFILKRARNADVFELNIQENTWINERLLIVGLTLLTIGNFLGAVWANESWGRYWGWDPKETWSLITIVLYVIVLHLRLIPGLKRPFAFNAAIFVGFGSLLMTYLGVNVYLSGLHSYAAGDRVPLPVWIYIVTIGIFVMVFLAWRKREIHIVEDH